LLQAAGTGVGALALGGAGFAAAPLAAQDIQIGGTPPAAPVIEPAPPSGETVANVAARLNYDAEAIFAFVRDEIHYESYAGVLRGARGTLWARAAQHAADQAVLLGELLAASQIPYRFAVGPLEGTQVDALTARLTLTRDAAYAAFYDATIAASLYTLGVAELPEATLDAAAPPALAGFDTAAQAAIDLAHASLERSNTAIMAALDAGGVTLPPLESHRLTDRELNQHAWIQVPDGPDWLDYDPSLPEEALAAGPVAASETPDALPDDWRHHVKYSIAADDHTFGTLSRREVVAYSATSDALVDVPVAISMAAPEDLSSLGMSLTELFTGQKSIFPSIYAAGVTVDAVQPLVFATGEATAEDPFGGSGGGPAEGETLAVWLVVEITSPDEAPVVIERALIDRVPPDDRASGLVVPENIAPVTMTPNALGEQTLPEFNVLPVIHTDLARLPAVNAMAHFAEDEVYGGLGLLGPALAGFREALGEEEEAPHGYWSYPSAPNVTVFHASLPATGEETASIAVDLIHRRRTSLPLTDVEPSVTIHPLVLSGLLDAIAEHTMLAPETRGDLAQSSPYAVGPSITGIVDAAATAGLDFRLLTSAADLAGIDADPASQRHITAALEVGQYVVVPEAPVAFDGKSLLGWWIVDPATGRTRDQLQNGMASASARFPGRPAPFLAQTGEYSFLTRAVLWVASNGRGFACLGFGVAAGIVWAVALIHGLRGGSAGRSAAAGGLASAGGVAGAMGAC